ncbi:MAG: hypothetical protein ACK4VV_07545 [Pseudomonas sp.]
MEKTADRYALSPWLGEFRIKETEQAYRKHAEQNTAKNLRIGLTVWAILLVLFGWLDYMALGNSDGFYHLMGTRVFSASLLLSLAWRLRSKPELANDGNAVTALEIFGFGLFFLIYFARPDITSWNIGVTLIILISIYIFIPNRVMLSNLVALFGIVGTLYCVSLLGVPTGLLVGLAFVLTLPAVIGYFAALRLQSGQRQQYALFNETVKVNLSLQ